MYVCPKSPRKGQNWENAWTDSRAGTLHLSGVQMLFKEITEAVSPKVLRTILNLGGSNLICLWHAFKERDPAAKVTKQKEVWPSYWEKRACSWHADGAWLSFPFICVNSEKIIRR